MALDSGPTRGRAALLGCLVAAGCAVPGAREATFAERSPASVSPAPAEASSLHRPLASLLAEPPQEVAFVLDGVEQPAFPWLMGYRDASIERLGPMRLYQSGKWGRWIGEPLFSFDWAPKLSASDDAIEERVAIDDEEPPLAALSAPAWSPRIELLPAPGEAATALAAPVGPRLRPLMFESSGVNVAGNGFDRLYRLAPTEPVKDWRCRRKPVKIIRYGAESSSVELVRCDGTIPPGAHDRLSILARPPEVPSPGSELPEQPDERAWSERREWVSGVRLVHPRLLWALQRVADEFPRRAVYVISGYRPLARVGGGTMDEPGDGHRSTHADGRALDFHVQGVKNEEVFKLCQTLKDVGCGFYPNSKFIHLDVRRAHTGKAMWIDASAPGEPSRYVDSWPGVVESGAMSWVSPDRRVSP